MLLSPYRQNFFCFVYLVNHLGILHQKYLTRQQKIRQKTPPPKAACEFFQQTHVEFRIKRKERWRYIKKNMITCWNNNNYRVNTYHSLRRIKMTSYHAGFPINTHPESRRSRPHLRLPAGNYQSYLFDCSTSQRRFVTLPLYNRANKTSSLKLFQYLQHIKQSKLSPGCNDAIQNSRSIPATSHNSLFLLTPVFPHLSLMHVCNPIASNSYCYV